MPQVCNYGTDDASTGIRVKKGFERYGLLTTVVVHEIAQMMAQNPRISGV
jgi:hypothetical protein